MRQSCLNHKGFFNLLHFINLLICTCIPYTHTEAMAHGNWLFPSTTGVLEIKLRLGGLTISAFTCQLPCHPLRDFWSFTPWQALNWLLEIQQGKATHLLPALMALASWQEGQVLMQESYTRAWLQIVLKCVEFPKEKNHLENSINYKAKWNYQ